MPPIAKLPRHNSLNRASRLLYTLVSLAINTIRASLLSSKNSDQETRIETHTFSKRASEVDLHEPKSIVFIVLIPVLVLMSGLFAGLTLGYMSLDETQLSVLSVSGTPKQREYARKIQPIRKNGHLLLVTLLLSNMIVNESLPIIADPVLGGGVQSVVASTVLIVIFSEIIPQSIFTRHGLYLGAKMAGLTTVLIWVMGIIAWPVAKLLEWILGPHHGIIYRRGELKELIAMHSNTSPHGGDLKSDTVNIIGATLDFQEKTVFQAMTPISNVFMISIDSKLDSDTMMQIVNSGHSRIPVFEEINMPPSLQMIRAEKANEKFGNSKPEKVKRILGALLVKRLVLLNVQDAVPVRSLQLNKVFSVPSNQSLLGILDKFQEGHSHLAIVSPLSIEKAETVKNIVKHGLTKRLKDTMAAWDSDSEDIKKVDLDEHPVQKYDIKVAKQTGEESPTVLRNVEVSTDMRERLEMRDNESHYKFQKEQAMSDDAVLSEENVETFLEGLDSAVMPLGIITLEDVLEEIIGEDIFDEFDTGTVGNANTAGIVKSGSFRGGIGTFGRKSMKFMRSISAPQIPRLQKRKSTKDVNVNIPKPEPGTQQDYDARTPEVPSPISIGATRDSEREKSMSNADAMVDSGINRPSRSGTPIEKVIARRRSTLRSSSSPGIEPSRSKRARTRRSFKSEPLEEAGTQRMLEGQLGRDSPEPIIPIEEKAVD